MLSALSPGSRSKSRTIWLGVTVGGQSPGAASATAGAERVAVAAAAFINSRLEWNTVCLLEHYLYRSDKGPEKQSGGGYSKKPFLNENSLRLFDLGVVTE
jgi:hypothetical protein